MNINYDVERMSRKELEDAYFGLGFKVEELMGSDVDEIIILRETLRALPSFQIKCDRVNYAATVQTCQMLTLLMTGRICTKEQLVAAGAKNDLSQPKLADVVICKLRKPLKSIGVEIETVWGVGYVMRKPSIDILKSLVKAQSPTPQQEHARHKHLARSPDTRPVDIANMGSAGRRVLEKERDSE